jgi:hypothetical protein
VSAVKTTPELVRPAGSHWLEPRRNSGSGPFGREELYPILELELARVGKVRATFAVDRYQHSSGWSDWRVVLRDVRTPDPERPELVHLGRDAAGVGPAARKAITEACAPIVRAWLETPAYLGSRRREAARVLARELEAPPSWRTDRGRQLLAELRAAGELGPTVAVQLEHAIDLLDQARDTLEAAQERAAVVAEAVDELD